MKKSLLLTVCVSMALMAAAQDVPSQVFDLANWKLNIPVAGSNGWSKEIKQPELATYSHSDFFHVSQDGNAVVFKAPVEGITTNGSQYPRSELREMVNGGSDKADWNIAVGNGVHIMEITQAVTHLPDYKKHVVVGQIHDANDDVIVFRLEGKKLWVDHNGSKGALLTDSYELGTPFTVKFVAGNGKVDSYYNGTLAESYPTNAEHCYFKAGMYTQSNLSKGDVAGAYGEAEIYSLTVTHTTSTPISHVVADGENANNRVYTLSGLEVETPIRGVYVQNGRSFLVK